MTIARVVLAAILLATVPAMSPAAAQQPAAEARAAQPYVVGGFRKARFDMTAEEVRVAIGEDFPGATVEEAASEVDGTTALVLRLAQLAPAPGDVGIVYIFGKESRRLMHVNVSWLLDGARADTGREELMLAAVKLVDYFQSFAWPSDQAVGGVPAGPDAMILFLAKDAKGSAVEVRVDGVAFRRQGESVAEASAPPTGPARLRIAYSRNPDRPDILTIREGDF